MNLFLLLLLLLWKGCALSTSSDPPQIDGPKEVVVEMDGSVDYTCRGSEQLYWTTPAEANVKADTYNVSKLPVPEGGFYVTDVGYYYCHYRNVTSFDNDKEKVASTYVYVEDEYEPFVRNRLHAGEVTTSETFVVDCRVTHPDVMVTLWFNDVDLTNEDRVSFDPRKGFSVKGAKMIDSGTYKCRAGDVELGKPMTVNPGVKQMRKPIILEGKNQHYVIGESFYLECLVIDPEEMTFTWTYPNSKANHAQEEHEVTRGNSAHSQSILRVENASRSDTGNYTCSVRTADTMENNVSINITIIESLASFVNISRGITIPTHEGEFVNWKAKLLYYPRDPDITYTDWKRQQIKETDRVKMGHNISEAIVWLSIEDVQSSDFGNYTVTVTTADGAATASSTALIEVLNAPHIKLKGIPHFLAEGMALNVSCLAEGFPRANVTLEFQECTDGMTLCGSTKVVQAVKEGTFFPNPGNVVEKSVTFFPDTSGLLKCTGSNEYGDNNRTTSVKISDIGGLFILRHHGRRGLTEVGNRMESISIVENDDFTLTCGGNKYDYESVNLTHTFPNSSSTSVFSIYDSNFSWVIKKVAARARKDFRGKYSCIGKHHQDQQLHIKSLSIAVLDEKNVYFEENTNLKNQSIHLTEKKPFNLTCNATGVPEPSILWRKNGKVLTNTSQSFDRKAMKFSKDSKMLMIDYVFKKHEGVYTCVAKNRLNALTRSLTITVAAQWSLGAVKVWLAVGFVSIALLVVVVIYLLTQVKKKEHFRKSLRANVNYLFREGNVKQINIGHTIEKQASLLPYDPKWEVARSNITFGKMLGSGEFGQVVKATVRGLQGSTVTPVAIKMCKSSLDVTQLRSLTMELKIMIHLGQHLNIVNLMGANTVHLDKGELWILVEYCRFGNLLDFMHRHRRKFINQIDAATDKINFEKITQDPHSPLSHVSSIPAPVDSDGYLAPNSPQFILTNPPKGNAGKYVHPSSVSSSISVASENAAPSSMPGVDTADNPLYFNPGFERGEGGTNGCRASHASEGCRHSTHSTHRQASRSTSIPSQAETRRTSITSCGQEMSPLLSPTDSCFMGETHLDTKKNVFSYETGSVPGVTAPFFTTDLLCWGWQVAHGMEYLASRNVMHGDLAARNLLLADDNVVKISDFGMSRDIYKKDVYVKTKDALLPVKWMSIEAVRDRTFTIQSDVWAFGVMLWEVFSLGGSPYPDFDLNNFLQRLEDGYRMDCPRYANQDVYNVMLRCWASEPMDRPSFSQLVESLGAMVPPLITEKYLDFNATYLRMNEERFKDKTDYLLMMANPNYESMTYAEKPLDSDYINVEDQPDSTGSVAIHSRNTVVFYTEERRPSSSLSLGSDYLPMKGSSVPSTPSGDDFSPTPLKSSRFNFTTGINESVRLSSLPEEDTSLSDTKEPSEASSCTNFSVQSPSGDIAHHSKGANHVTKSNNSDANYINLPDRNTTQPDYLNMLS